MPKNPGNQIANRETVVDYLVANYVVERQDAYTLVDGKHAGKVQTDGEMRAFAYWTGDKIAREERLSPIIEPDVLDGEPVESKEDDDDGEA